MTIPSARALMYGFGWRRAALAALCAFIMFFHLWKLSSLPRGLYVDEVSVGYNAALVAQDGHDEHGAYLPVYFESFGEYKNPVYIYADAALFKLFGVSELTLRMGSALFFALFLGILCLLVGDLTGRLLPVGFVLLAGGTLPWFFTISRISFEVISQLPLVALAVWLAYRAYERPVPAGKWGSWLPVLAGFAIGFSIYGYTTGRLLAFAFLGLLIICYWGREYLRRHVLVAAGFVAGLLPYLAFSHSHPGALTARFKLISYLYDPSLSLLQKAGEFLGSYFGYLSPGFLLTGGDSNTRHHIGFGFGELFLSVAVLAGVGIVWAFLAQGRQGRRFWLFLLGNMLAAPAAASLTSGSPHALRSVLFGLYALLFASLGIAALARTQNRRLRVALVTTAFVLLGLEGASYLKAYFVEYPAVSAWAFEGYDFTGAMATALARHPHEVVVSRYANQPYVNLEFTRFLLPGMAGLPVRLGEPVAAPGRCVITFASDARLGNPHGLPATLSQEENYVKLHCY